MQGFTKYFRYAILNRGECMEIIIGIIFVILILLLTGLDIGWRSHRVFDRNALITSLVGLPVSLLIAAGFGGGLLMLLI